MTFDESEHTVIDVLPANGWKIGYMTDASEEIYGPFALIGFVLVRHSHGDGTFDVWPYPLTEGGTVDRGYALVRSDGTVSLPILEMEFRSLADCNTQLRKVAERKRAESKTGASKDAGAGLTVR
jgi:hypothetical protein